MVLSIFVHLFALQLFLSVHLFPINWHPSDFNIIEYIKPHYLKVKSLSGRRTDDETRPMYLANLEDIITMRRFNPDRYSDETLMKMALEYQKKGGKIPPEHIDRYKQEKKKKGETFQNQEWDPYIPGGEYVFARTVQSRFVETTPTLKPTGTYEKKYAHEPTTINPDCNQHCLRMYEDKGAVCAQRWVEPRKPHFRDSFLFFFGFWTYFERDAGDYWEFRDFKNICDLEFENCRNATNSGGWFPTHFGECQIIKTTFQVHPVTPAQQVVDRKMSHDSYGRPNYTTEIWMLFDN